MKQPNQFELDIICNLNIKTVTETKGNFMTIKDTVELLKYIQKLPTNNNTQWRAISSMIDQMEEADK